MTTSEVLELINYRIQFCANLYGAKWREELAILEVCKGALEDTITAGEADLISDVFQNYFCESLDEIAADQETAKTLFEKIGILEKQEAIDGREEKDTDSEEERIRH